jgi:hypothetical protein
MLEGHPELAAFGREALGRCPSQDVIDAAARSPLAWAPVIEQIELGRAAAEELLRTERSGLRLN